MKNNWNLVWVKFNLFSTNLCLKEGIEFKMIKQKKIYGIVLIITLMLLVFPIKIYASSMIDKIKLVEYTEEYKQSIKAFKASRK